MIITVLFVNGRKVDYTTAIYNLLITDPEVLMITEKSTGAILYKRGATV